MWTKASDAKAFAERRALLSARLSGPALLVAGQSRPRNFQHNRFPFRAESHFLYLVGRSLESAALLVTPTSSTLFAPPADPEAELWTGPMTSLDALSKELGLEVRPLEELQGASDIAALPPQDLETALWLSELLDRDLEPGGGIERGGVELKVDAERVVPVPTSTYPLPARRPLNSRLGVSKLQTAFDVHLPSWQVGVAHMLTEILAGSK